ncbi:MAG: sigma 54-interacting transcriptional regulator [Bacillota bacterium]
MKVKHVMISDPCTLAPHQTLEEAGHIFVSCDVNCAPVLSRNGDVLGIFTITDLVQSLLAGRGKDTCVSEVMQTNIPVINEDDSFEEVACHQAVERFVVKDGDGRLTGILSRVELIKKVFEVLNATRNELAVVLESVHNAIIAIDLDERIILFNRAAERFTGARASQVIGRKITEVIPSAGLPEILKDGSCRFGQRVRYNNTELVCNRTPIYYQNELIGAVSVFQDISELASVTNELNIARELNNELTSVIESSYDGILVVGREGDILRANSRSRAILGLEDQIAPGMTLRDFPEDQRKQLLYVLEETKSRRSTVSTSCKIKEKNIAFTGNPEFDGDNQVQRVVLNIRDMTELSQLKQEMEKNRDETARYFAELRELRAKQTDIKNILARSDAMKKVIKLALRVGQHDSTVLISGESGVGKEVVAKLLQKVSPRAGQPFVQINCGAIPENLLESELFGYEAGAFTGARKQGKIGLLEAANGGTLFLDEVGEIPLNLQVKLLRAIQERVIYRLGGIKPIELDIRIIAATNKDLEEMVKKNTFREDLFYRLNVIHIHIPPLRERKEDIIPLATYFLQRYNDKYGFGWRMSHEVYMLLEAYNWPGNIRELENVVERAVIMSDGELITSRHLPKKFIYNHDRQQIHFRLSGVMPLKDAVENLEKELVARALQEHGSTRRAAKALGVTHTTVQRKIKQYNLPEYHQ